MKTVNLKKHVWEGWTVQCFVDELEPQLDQARIGNSILRFPKSKDDLRKFLKENQPYYKKEIKDLVAYFSIRYGLK